MAVNKDGKYTKFDEKTLKLLEDAFAMDCPVIEACLKANISEPTYYAWIKKNPGLEKRFKILRKTPYLIARTTIMKGIKESPQYAFEYMKRKKKEEFGDTNKIELETINVTNKEKKTVGDVISNFLNDKDNKTNS